MYIIEGYLAFSSLSNFVIKGLARISLDGLILHILVCRTCSFCKLVELCSRKNQNFLFDILGIPLHLSTFKDIFNTTNVFNNFKNV